MPVPTWVVGQVLAAADVNSWMVPLAAVKATDQPLVSSTTFQNDTALVVPVAASATYIVDCYLFYAAAVGGDFKWQWAMPAGTVFTYQALHNEGGGTGLNNSAVTFIGGFVFAAGAGTGAAEAAFVHGTLAVGSTAGNMQLQWAQSASNAGATTVKAQSHLVLRRVA